MEIVLIIFGLIWIWGIYEWWNAPLMPDDFSNDEWEHEKRMTEYKDKDPFDEMI